MPFVPVLIREAKELGDSGQPYLKSSIKEKEKKGKAKKRKSRKAKEKPKRRKKEGTPREGR